MGVREGTSGAAPPAEIGRWGAGSSGPELGGKWARGLLRPVRPRNELQDLQDPQAWGSRATIPACSLPHSPVRPESGGGRLRQGAQGPSEPHGGPRKVNDTGQAEPNSQACMRSEREHREATPAHGHELQLSQLGRSGHPSGPVFMSTEQE